MLAIGLLAPVGVAVAGSAAIRMTMAVAMVLTAGTGGQGAPAAPGSDSYAAQDA